MEMVQEECRICALLMSSCLHNNNEFTDEISVQFIVAAL